MTEAAFRRMALRLPGVLEGAHMGHADFRVGGKIFASLGPEAGRAMVKLPPDEQADLVGDKSGAYVPAAGAWGLRGCTLVRLRSATVPAIREALAAAWRNTAPKRLVREHDGPRRSLKRQ